MNIGHGIEEQIPIFLSQQYAHCCFSRELLLESCRNLQQKKIEDPGVGPAQILPPDKTEPRHDEIQGRF